MIEINGTAGNDNLLGTSEADVILALDGNDILSGLGGGDSLFGFTGNDTLNGNEGNDTLFGNQNVDLLIGESGDDWLFGGKDGDVIEDGEGEDLLFGNLGDDVLRGGAGNDQRFGGKDNDTVIGGTGNDQVFGDRGNDILWGVDVDAVNPGTGEIDILTGGSELDIFVLGDESRLYYIGSGNNDFAIITDFNVLEDQIQIGNNQVNYTETTLNELGLGVAISSQSGDLVAFVQGATVSQVIEGSNLVESSITVEPPPPPLPPNTPPPIADNDNYTTGFESAIIVDAVSGVLNGDSNGDGDLISAILVNPPANGSLNLNPDGSFSYTPNNGFSGEDSFTYTANDGELNSNVATVTIAVDVPPPPPPPNTPPIADNDNYTTGFESAIIVDAVSGILNGDSDGDGDPISAILVNSPANGSVNLNPDGSFSYTPNPGFSGVDSFIYVANDGKDNSDVATVTIAVDVPQPQPTNTPPIADNDNYTTGFQSAIVVDAVSGILNGDIDGDGDPISAILVNSPANGSLNLNPDGSFSYTPNAGFSGVDSFIYVANDGKDNSDVATVTIAVDVPSPQPTNTPPIADNDNYITGFESAIVVDAVSGILNGDIDGDGDPISAILVNSPANGSLNLNPDGSFSYTPNAGFSGVDSFIYVANDGKDNSDIATVTINVEPQPNTPPVADNDNYTTGFQSPITVDASVGILNGDSDLDGDPLSAILVNPPANGSVNLNTDGSFSYTPNGGFSGVDSFTYTANDGKDNSDVAIVTIDVEQTKTLNGYSQRGVDDQTIFTTFLLTDVGSDGQVIVDQTLNGNGNDSNEELGFFAEAIQDFITYNNVSLTSSGESINFEGETELQNEGTLSFNEEGEPIFTGVNIETEIIPVVDLRVRLIERDDIITELEPTDFSGDPIVELDESFQGDIIVYEFLESGTETVLEELLLFTSEFSAIPDIANLATNSLENIISLDLLSLTFEKQDIGSILLGQQTPIERRLDGFNFVNLEKAEPALPQTYSQREVNNSNTVLSTFLLTNNGDNGQLIEDQTLDENGNDNNPELGLFPEALQDFVSYNNESGIALDDDSFSSTPRINFNGETELQGEGTLSFNEEGEPIFTGVEVETEITPVVDLRVRLIERDDIIAELEPTDEEGNPIVELDESFLGNIIVYEFLNSETETVLEELFLFTEEFPDLETFNNVFTDDSLDQSDKINLATNSLESILNENLLPFTLTKQDAIQVVVEQETPRDVRLSLGFSFVNTER